MSDKKLPEGWEVKRLIEVAEPTNSGVKQFFGKKRYIATGNVIVTEIINFQEVSYNDRPSRANMEAQEGDVLFAKMKDTFKILFIDKEKSNNIYSTGFFVFRPNQDFIIPNFLFYYFQTDYFINLKDLFATGSTQVALTNRFLDKFEIPIPPLPVQQKIVSKLDAFFKHYNRLKEEKRKAKENYEKILQNAIEEFIFRNKEGKDYQEVKMEQVIVDCRYGTSKKTHFNGKGIPVLRIPNIIKGNIDFTDLKSAEFSENEKKTLKVRNGDILLVRTNGSLDLVGRGAVVPKLENEFIFASYLIRLKPKLDTINPYFLNYVLMTNFVRNQFIDRSHTTAGQFNINSKQIKSIRFPLPPINKQNEIVNNLSKIKNIINEILPEQKNNDLKIEQLPKAVLSKAFGGEI